MHSVGLEPTTSSFTEHYKGRRCQLSYIAHWFHVIGKIGTKLQLLIIGYCRVPIWGAPFTVDVSKPKSNRPNTMNLVEKRA